MGKRQDLQAILEELVGEGGEVYFQPPENTQIVYPCILYERDYALTNHADNNPYRHTKRYQLTVADEDPDSLIVDRVAMLPMTTYIRHFVSDGLHHDVYTTYF